MIFVREMCVGKQVHFLPYLSFGRVSGAEGQRGTSANAVSDPTNHTVGDPNHHPPLSLQAGSSAGRCRFPASAVGCQSRRRPIHDPDRSLRHPRHLPRRYFPSRPPIGHLIPHLSLVFSPTNSRLIFSLSFYLASLEGTLSFLPSSSPIPRLLSPSNPIKLRFTRDIATAMSISRLLASAPASTSVGRAVVSIPNTRFAATTAAAGFSSSARQNALPSGPPPANFRPAPPRRWDQSKEHILDKAGKYFLMTELMRGMYVVLEQFFRPP